MGSSQTFYPRGFVYTKEMLNTIRSWSPELYSIPAVLSAALDRLSHDSESSHILMTCIAELYVTFILFFLVAYRGV